MKNKLFIFGLISFIFTHCTKIIDLNLPESEAQLVVFGEISNIKPHKVQLTKSTSIFDTTTIQQIHRANVSVTTPNGEVHSFIHQSEGMYYNYTLDIAEKYTYTLNIVNDGEEYQAQTTVPSLIVVDTITILDSNTRNISLHWKDPAEQVNFYRPLITDVILKRQNNYDFIDKFHNITDRFFNGKDFVYNTGENNGDSLVVELISINKLEYDFYRILEETQNSNEDGPFGSTPGNPEGNISNNAIGIFTSNMVSSDTLKFPRRTFFPRPIN